MGQLIAALLLCSALPSATAALEGTAATATPWCENGLRLQPDPLPPAAVQTHEGGCSSNGG